jgi:D-alanyl-D-alanine carboxypeptidase
MTAKRSKTLGVVGTLFVFVTTTAACAGKPPPLFSQAVTDQLDATLGMTLTTNNLPSAAVEIDVPAKGRYDYVAGLADIASNTPRRLGQPFRIASLTKTFVATAILQLVDAGLLRKTDLMAKWYPTFPNAIEITVDDLLRMRSGIAAPSDEAVIDAIYDNPTAPAPTLRDLMAQSAALAAKFMAPNQEGIYTNLNYDILGDIAQRVAGQPVGVLITKNIIHTLHLHHTSYPSTDDDLPGDLHGYGLDPQTGALVDKTLFNPALAGPAGAMISTIGDLTRYVRILCVGGLLTPETQSARMQGQALVGTTTKYGEGVITGPKVCGHSGTIPGFSTDMYYFPDVDATVVINVNRLDRDDESQTTPVLKAATDALVALFGQ